MTEREAVWMHNETGDLCIRPLLSGNPMSGWWFEVHTNCFQIGDTRDWECLGEL
jgi:hypothetical protein